jgi:hypothetical protein
MIAALGPHTRAYQRNAPSVPHRHNSVDIVAFIAKDDAEHLGDVATIALIAGTAAMLRAVERGRGNRRAHGGSP